MTLIRKYAAPLALLSTLGAVAAAPYLVPENPDSAVFRSGLLGLVLVLACIRPLEEAFRKAGLRTLLCGGVLGLLLGGALGIGAELTFYGGLLPGMGSMLRRLAVPVMITPLLGGLAARAMLAATEHKSTGKTGRLPMAAYMAILLLCWLPLLIAYYPGMLNYDFHTEYNQYLTGQWDNRHPLLYIVLCHSLFSLGDVIGQPELAVFGVTLIRIVTFAAALAYSCVFVQRRRAPRWALAVMTAGYALLPVFSVMAVSSAKDTPFAAAVLVLSLLIWEALEDPKAFFAEKRKGIAFAIAALFTWHMRKNGVAVMLMLPLLIAGAKGCRAQMTKLCAASVALCILLSFGMNAALKPADQPSFQTYSIPAQQLVRAYNLGDMTDAEREELCSWYVDSDWGLQLLPHLADAAKGSLDSHKLAAEGDAFMDLWARVGKRNLRIYTEAFLLLNIGSWYPDDQSHSTIYQEYGQDKGYLQLSEYDMSDCGIDSRDLLPGVRSFYEQICRRNEYQDIPVISQLLCTATPLWVILFACCALIASKRGRLALCASGVLVLHMSYLLGPCTLARYMLPMFCFAPVLLILSLCIPVKEHV